MDEIRKLKLWIEEARARRAEDQHKLAELYRQARMLQEAIWGDTLRINWEESALRELEKGSAAEAPEDLVRCRGEQCSRCVR